MRAGKRKKDGGKNAKEKRKKNCTLSKEGLITPTHSNWQN